MENVSRIGIGAEYNLDSQKRKMRSREKVNKKRIARANVQKKHIIIFNTCISIILVILLVVGYSEMLNISSDNVLISEQNKNFEIEINALTELVEPYRSEERIKNIAITRLGMVYPTKDNFAKLDDNNSKTIKLSDLSSNKKTNQKDSFLSIFSNILR